MIGYIRKLCKGIGQDERGLTAVEYAVLGAIIVGAIGVATAGYEGALTGAFEDLFTAAQGGSGSSTGG